MNYTLYVLCYELKIIYDLQLIELLSFVGSKWHYDDRQPALMVMITEYEDYNGLMGIFELL
jgi:hypothetical protein